MRQPLPTLLCHDLWITFHGGLVAAAVNEELGLVEQLLTHTH
jgi:hypothetical protein